MNRQKYIYTLLCLSLVLNVFAQNLGNFNFEYYDNSSGLSSSEIRRLHKDREGLLWLATGNGLVQYDGQNFITYRSEIMSNDLLGDNNIMCVTDTEDYLWIGTATGLYKRNKISHQITKVLKPGIANRTIAVLRTDPDGFIWIGTSKGISKYYPQQDSIKTYTSNGELGSLSGINVKDIMVDSRQRVWIALWKSGLCRYDRDNDSFIVYPSLNKDNSAHILFEDRDKNIFVGTWGFGLIRLEKEESPQTVHYFQYSRKGEDDGAPVGDIIYSIAQDNRFGYIWMGTRNGLSILTDTQDTHSFVNFIYGRDKYPTNEEVSDIFCDKEGIVWLSTLGGGLNKLNINIPKIQYNALEWIKQKYNGNNLQDVYVDTDGLFYLAVKNKGLFLYDSDTNSYWHCSQVEGLNILSKEINIKDITYISRYDCIWISTINNGIWQIKKIGDSKKFTAKKISENISNEFLPSKINTVYEDNSKNIWIGSENGFTVITADTVIRCKPPVRKNQKSVVAIVSISEDVTGRIWLGTFNHGLYRAALDSSGKLSISNYCYENGKINNNHILSVLVDKKGNIWTGTCGGGLNKYSTQCDNFESVNTEFDIPYDDIFNLMCDNKGILWACSHSALLRINLESNEHTKIFTSSDGLWQNILTYNREPLALKNGSFLICGIRGYNILYPEKIEWNTEAHKVIIQDIKIKNESIFSTCELLKNCNYDGKSITLPHDYKTLVFDFTAPSYNNPEVCIYEYRMLGYEEVWHRTNAKTKNATYTNLSKGNYTFQVRASNENGTWNKDFTEFFVCIKPSPFASWYAWIIYITIICVVIILSFKATLERLRIRRKLSIAEMQAQNAKELSILKMKFFTNISHELLTPLSIINCSVEEIEERGRINKSQIDVIKGNTNRLRRLIRQVLEFRKAETDNLKLEVSKRDISSIVKSIADINFAPLSSKKCIKLSVSSSPEHIIGYIDCDKVDKIIYNLLSNAMKYNDKQEGVTNISLEEFYEGSIRKVKIIVSDNGIGIKSEKLPYIFQRYYDGAYRLMNTDGTGIGLSLTKTLVELHKGEISVDSIEGQGTKFTIIFPLDSTSYPEESIEKNEIVENTSEAKGKNLITESENCIENYKEKDIMKYNILLVDDNEDLLDTMTSILENLYHIDKATDGAKALKILKEGDIDLVISDIMMPIMDGMTLCSRIKGDIETSHIPVILLSARTTEEDFIEGYNVGADAYIAKPFGNKVLKARIANFLEAQNRKKRDFKVGNSIQLNELTYTSLDEEFMKKAVAIVEEKLTDYTFGFDQFADLMYVSKSMLYRKIKALTGMTTGDFIKNIRLQKACSILEKGHVNISEVAYAVGFNEPKYFTLCFRKKFGLPPSEYFKKKVDENK